MGAKKLNLSFFFLFVSLIIFNVNAANAQEDFTATSSPSVELCPCSSQAYYVTIKNTGSAASSYSLIADGDAAAWVTFEPDSFVLEAGQEASFYVIANSVCNIKGSYNLDIYIKTSNGLTKLIKQTLNIKECYDYSLEAGAAVEEAQESINYLQQKGAYNLCINKQKSIPILIKNNENFGNIYRIFLDAPEWAKLSLDSVELGAKNSGVFLVNLDTTNIIGDFNFKLDAISELGKAQRKINFDVNIGECYSLELDVDKEKDVICAEEKATYNTKLKNSGTLGQEIKINADAEWAALNNEIYLEPNEEKSINLSLKPPKELSGEFTVTVLAVPDNKTEFASSDKIDVDVISKLKCYEPKITAKSVVSNKYKEDIFYASVINKGIKKSIYNINLEGPPWASINPQTLELNPGQKGNLNVKLNPSTDSEPNTYGIKINLESNGALYSKNIDINLKKETDLEKKIKSTIKSLEYYFYLLIAVIVLIIIFIKPINKIRNNIREKYQKYKIRKERIRNLRIARKKIQEEKRKLKEIEEKREKTIKKEVKAEKKIQKKKPFKGFNKKWIYAISALILLVSLFLGQYYKLYNLKYAHIYLRNIVYGYLYYILIGLAVVALSFFSILAFNYIKKRPKKIKRAKEARIQPKKEAKTKDRWYNKPYYVLAVFVPIIALVIASAYFNFFDDIWNFIVLYQYYFMAGIGILIVLILILRFYKKLA